VGGGLAQASAAHLHLVQAPYLRLHLMRTAHAAAAASAAAAPAAAAAAAVGCLLSEVVGALVQQAAEERG